jgi:hypothetical protein
MNSPEDCLLWVVQYDGHMEEQTKGFYVVASHIEITLCMDKIGE